MMPNFTEMFLRLRRALEFSHDQDPSRTLAIHFCCDAQLSAPESANTLPLQERTNCDSSWSARRTILVAAAFALTFLRSPPRNRP